MSGLDKIINGIALEADAEAKKTGADAKEKAERIIRRARERGREIVSEAHAAAETESAKIAARANAAADAAKKRAVLREKQRIISEVCENAVALVEGCDPQKYFELLQRLLDKYAEDKPGEIVLSDRAKTRITPEFSAAIKERGLTLSERQGDFRGGFILVYGDIEENCTLEALMESGRDSLHDTISKFLFG